MEIMDEVCVGRDWLWLELGAKTDTHPKDREGGRGIFLYRIES